MLDIEMSPENRAALTAAVELGRSWIRGALPNSTAPLRKLTIADIADVGFRENRKNFSHRSNRLAPTTMNKLNYKLLIPLGALCFLVSATAHAQFEIIPRHIPSLMKYGADCNSAAPNTPENLHALRGTNAGWFANVGKVYLPVTCPVPVGDMVLPVGELSRVRLRVGHTEGPGFRAMLCFRPFQGGGQDCGKPKYSKFRDAFDEQTLYLSPPKGDFDASTIAYVFIEFPPGGFVYNYALDRR